ncbi:Protein SMG7 [Cytospora mali]|uniref:Nonsense-mediated mRNA decay factor n=1 Tax=Cytospora mali TaxID=578113 RepID=A0A194VP85_CYTMA|nr:Protein SMG7 [Valsa mali]
MPLGLRFVLTELQSFRLRYVYTIGQDPRYIHKKQGPSKQDAEDVLWQLHIYINKAYRDILNDRLRGQQNVITRRKVEKLYINYLKTAQAFYQGYFQRLQSAHGLPQIPRINSVLKLQAPEVDERQSQLISTENILRSFHSTLLHLGDLARWRHKARPKPDGFKMALLYYDLAHDVRPTSGDAHHQMGMIYIEEHNHLLVVYHLYRSLAIDLPHGNSTRNLEIEFKQLLQSTAPTRRAGPPDPNDAFSNWFVKLHARFYKGEQFSQQAELENEVLYRLEMMLKKPASLPLILKMVLINIAAYYVAKSRVEKNWTLEASNSCQFILGLNVKWILILSRLLQSELQEFSKAAAPAEDDEPSADDGTKPAGKFSAFTENILPLMRIYTAWLYIYRADVVGFQEHLGNSVYDMYRNLAHALTAVAKEFKGVAPMGTSPYLLPEDMVALGMKPFDDPRMATICRLHIALDSNTFKPHWEDSGLPRNGPEIEMRARVYDLMNCGFSLALDDFFPLAARLPPEGSDDAITMTYVEGGKAPRTLQDAAVSSQIPSPANQFDQLEGQFRNLRPSQEDHRVRQASTDNSGVAAMSAIGNIGHGHVRAPSASTTLQGAPAYDQAGGIDPVETESDLNLDAQMHALVDDLLDEDGSGLTKPQSRPRSITTGLEASSYGMHTATAQQVFGGLQTPGHVAGALFGKVSPWGSYVSPPQNGASRRESTTPQYDDGFHLGASSPIRAPRTSSTSSLQPNFPAFTPGPRLQPGSDFSALFTSSTAQAPGSQFGQASLGFSGRSSSGLSGKLQGSRGSIGHSRQRLGGSTDSSGASPFFSPKLNAGTYEITSGAQNVGQINPLANGASPPLGFGIGPSSFSTVFSQTASGLPPVNSPFGLPAGQLDGSFDQGEIYPYNQQFAGPFPAYKQPNNMNAVCNGNVYDATTAFGRGAIATKDDPTHFRNAVKGTHMSKAVAAADAFDRAILESALTEDNPRPKR